MTVNGTGYGDVYLREPVNTLDGAVVFVWHVAPPPAGAGFQVILEDWETPDGECPTRHIYGWRYT